MAGIAGISEPNRTDIVTELIDAVECNGDAGTEVFDVEAATLANVYSPARKPHLKPREVDGVVLDGEVFNWLELAPDSAPTSPIEAVYAAYCNHGPEFVRKLDGPFALAIATADGIFLARDRVGIAPLYYGFRNGRLCYASCAKALIGKVDKLSEFPPGHYYLPGRGLVEFARITEKEPLDLPAADIARELRRLLVQSIAKRADYYEMGCWLSGGLDSSAMAALAAKQCGRLRTFAVGLEGSPDISYARQVADFIGSKHYEMICTPKDLISVLPDVIYNLESFDALLVRSSVTNYLVGKLASEYVPAAMSGEGGDELFAGYEYLKGLDVAELPAELVDITNRLHNTALQRVDRCSKAHGLVARVGFLDNDVLDYALRIPAEYKIYRGGQEGGAVEKWILRRALDGLLPEEVLDRTKAKFWEGAGVTDNLARHAESVVSDSEFAARRKLPDGQILNSKEELYYYDIFRDRIGDLDEISFVGRTKGAPVS